jgi:MoaA/NifB/PqqE/SkfB family radical SAM enzyme
LRVSIDGLNGTHDEVRGIPGGFKKCEQTLDICREAGIEDLGIGFTLLQRNVNELDAVHRWAEERKLQLSITIATDSAIYFGAGKESMRPKDSHAVRQAFGKVIDTQLRKFDLKENFRGWFNRTMLEYHETNKRPFPCDGGSGYFYMDSFGSVFRHPERAHRSLRDQVGKGVVVARGRPGPRRRRDKCWLLCRQGRFQDHSGRSAPR